MGRAKDQWIAEHEAVFDNYHDNLTRGMSREDAEESARATLRSLGFDPHEIDDQIAGLEE